MQLQMSSFYSQFKADLDYWTSTSNPSTSGVWQSELYLVVNQMLTEHLRKFQVLNQRHTQMLHVNSKLVMWV